VLVDGIYNCAVSPYGDGCLLYLQCKLVANKVNKISLCETATNKFIVVSQFCNTPV
jgi:hypothetical protein